MTIKNSILSIGLTGGTIGSETDKSGRREYTDRSKEHLAREVSRILRISSKKIRVTGICFGDSTDLQSEEDRAKMLHFLLGNEEDSDVGESMLLHGTDTMADSGAYLALGLGNQLRKKIVMTGSQRGIKDDGTDAPNNIRLAYDALIAANDWNNSTPLLAFGGRVMPVINAVKTSAKVLNPFQNSSSLIEVSGYDSSSMSFSRFNRTNIPQVPIEKHTGSHIHAVRVIDADADSISALEDAWKNPKVQGIILRARGTGQVAQRIKEYVEKQMKIRPIFVGAVGDIAFTFVKKIYINGQENDSIHYLGGMTHTTARYKLANVLSRVVSDYGVLVTKGGIPTKPLNLEAIVRYMMTDFTTFDFGKDDTGLLL